MIPSNSIMMFQADMELDLAGTSWSPELLLCSNESAPVATGAAGPLSAQVPPTATSQGGLGAPELDGILEFFQTEPATKAALPIDDGTHLFSLPPTTPPPAPKALSTTPSDDDYLAVADPWACFGEMQQQAAPFGGAYRQTPSPVLPASPTGSNVAMGGAATPAHSSVSGEESDLDNEQLIEEVEDFIRQSEMFQQQQGNNASVDSSYSDQEMAEVQEILKRELTPQASPSRPASSSADCSDPLTAQEAEEAEIILQALVKGNLEEVATTASQATHSLNISNISQVLTDDGQQVVIVVTKDETTDVVRHPQLAPPSPPASSSSDSSASSSDSEYSPDSPVGTLKKASSGGVKKAGRGSGYKRGPYKKSAHSGLVDKKERKKRQNVEAARRYRDKKKSEQSSVEVEEQMALEQNEKLKSKLSETESELKTLKKLMAELGLIKLNKNKSDKNAP